MGLSESDQHQLLDKARKGSLRVNRTILVLAVAVAVLAVFVIYLRLASWDAAHRNRSLITQLQKQQASTADLTRRQGVLLQQLADNHIIPAPEAVGPVSPPTSATTLPATAARPTVVTSTTTTTRPARASTTAPPGTSPPGTSPPSTPPPTSPPSTTTTTTTAPPPSTPAPVVCRNVPAPIICPGALP